jgi:hypothetical protein
MRFIWLIRNYEHSCHRMAEALGGDKEVVPIVPACRDRGCMDDARDQSEPASCPELLGRAVPICTYEPRAPDLGQGRGYRV